jgi:predicted transcriptional regulator
MLELLCASTHTRDELQEKLDVHRTTLQKNLHELMERNWVTSLPSTNAYQASPAGQIVIDNVQRILPEIHIAERFDEFLPLLPVESQIDMHTLRDCAVTHSKEHGSHAPMQRVLIQMRESNTVRGSTSVFNPMYVAPFKNSLPGGCTFEIIGTPDFFQRVRDNFPTALETALAADSTQLLVLDTLPQFSVGLLDNVGVIATYDGNMRLQSLLEADSTQQQVFDWIKHQYESQKETAIDYETWAEEAVRSQ